MPDRGRHSAPEPLDPTVLRRHLERFGERAQAGAWRVREGSPVLYDVGLLVIGMLFGAVAAGWGRWTPEDRR